MKNFNEMNKEQLRQECREAGIKYGKMNNPEMREALLSLENTPTVEDESKPIKAYKAFDKDWKCRGFQFEVGKSYTHNGDVKACNSGFHAVTFPLDMFKYYNPCSSQFAMVECSGVLDYETSDSKLASQHLKVDKEIGFKEIVKDSIKIIKDTAAFATSGDYSNAATSGADSVAAAIGRHSKAKAGITGAIMLSEFTWCDVDNTYKLSAVFASLVGENGIKPNTWYKLENGKPVEVEE